MATIFGDLPTTDLSYTGVQYTFNDYLTWFGNVDLAIPPYVFPSTIVSFGNQNLSGSGASIAYGDLRDLTMTATGGTPLTTPLITANVIAGYTFDMGDDTLTFGNANNTLYGDMRDLTQNVVGGTSTATNLSDTSIQDNTFNFGIDTISAGNGANTVYGDARDFVFKIQGGSNPYGVVDPTYEDGTGAGSSDGISSTQIINLAYDKITLGNGNNTVYGDIRDVTIDFRTGSGYADGIHPFTIVVEGASIFNFGANTIKVGNGNNTIFGNFEDWSIYCNGGTLSGISTSDFLTGTNGGFGSSTITMLNNNPDLTNTNDIITIGNGKNTVYADGRSLSITIDGGKAIGGDSTFAFSSGNSFAFGNDRVSETPSSTAKGSNLVYGDLQDMTLSVIGGENVNASFSAGSQIRASTYTMGNDNVTLGNGNNTVYGDMNDVNWQAKGGLNSIEESFGLDRLVSLTGNHLIMGDDTIAVGNGSNTLYGDAHNVTLRGEGGIGDLHNSPGALSFRATGGSNVIDFGDDMISSIKGNNLVAGDAWDVLLEAKGGHASNDHYAWGKANTVGLHFGDDTMTLGSGNDTVYGDAHSFSMNSLGGVVDSSGGDARGLVTNNVVEFGGNNLSTGAGNDTLYANVELLNLLALDGINNAGLDGIADAVMTGNSIVFGNSTLNGGSGNNNFYGNAKVVTGLDEYLANGNTITWSTDNTFIGGSGIDKYNFTLFDQSGLVAQGNTTIVNFNAAGGDRLVFDAPGTVSYANLNAAITITHVSGDTILTFHDGSSVTLDNVNIAQLNSANTVIV